MDSSQIDIRKRLLHGSNLKIPNLIVNSRSFLENEKSTLYDQERQFLKYKTQPNSLNASEKRSIRAKNDITQIQGIQTERTIQDTKIIQFGKCFRRRVEACMRNNRGSYDFSSGRILSRSENLGEQLSSQRSSKQSFNELMLEQSREALNEIDRQQIPFKEKHKSQNGIKTLTQCLLHPESNQHSKLKQPSDNEHIISAKPKLAKTLQFADGDQQKSNWKINQTINKKQVQMFSNSSGSTPVISPTIPIFHKNRLSSNFMAQSMTLQGQRSETPTRSDIQIQGQSERYEKQSPAILNSTRMSSHKEKINIKEIHDEYFKKTNLKEGIQIKSSTLIEKGNEPKKESIKLKIHPSRRTTDSHNSSTCDASSPDSTSYKINYIQPYNIQDDGVSTTNQSGVTNKKSPNRSLFHFFSSKEYLSQQRIITEDKVDNRYQFDNKNEEYANSISGINWETESPLPSSKLESKKNLTFSRSSSGQSHRTVIIKPTTKHSCFFSENNNSNEIKQQSSLMEIQKINKRNKNSSIKDFYDNQQEGLDNTLILRKNPQSLKEINGIEKNSSNIIEERQQKRNAKDICLIIEKHERQIRASLLAELTRNDYQSKLIQDYCQISKEDFIAEIMRFLRFSIEIMKENHRFDEQSQNLLQFQSNINLAPQMKFQVIPKTVYDIIFQQLREMIESLRKNQRNLLGIAENNNNNQHESLSALEQNNDNQFYNDLNFLASKNLLASSIVDDLGGKRGVQSFISELRRLLQNETEMEPFYWDEQEQLSFLPAVCGILSNDYQILSSMVKSTPITLTSTEYFLFKRFLIQQSSLEMSVTTSSNRLLRSELYKILQCIENTRFIIQQKYEQIFSSSMISLIASQIQLNKTFLQKKIAVKYLPSFVKELFEVLFFTKDKRIEFIANIARLSVEPLDKIFWSSILDCFLFGVIDNQEESFDNFNTMAADLKFRFYLLEVDSKLISNSIFKLITDIDGLINRLFSWVEDQHLLVGDAFHLDLLTSFDRRFMTFFLKTALVYGGYSAADIAYALSCYKVSMDILAFWMQGIKEVLITQMSSIEDFNSIFEFLCNQLPSFKYSSQKNNNYQKQQ